MKGINTPRVTKDKVRKIFKFDWTAFCTIQFGKEFFSMLKSHLVSSHSDHIPIMLDIEVE